MVNLSPTHTHTHTHTHTRRAHAGQYRCRHHMAHISLASLTRLPCLEPCPCSNAESSASPCPSPLLASGGLGWNPPLAPATCSRRPWCCMVIGDRGMLPRWGGGRGSWKSPSRSGEAGRRNTIAPRARPWYGDRGVRGDRGTSGERAWRLGISGDTALRDCVDHGGGDVGRAPNAPGWASTGIAGNNGCCRRDPRMPGSPSLCSWGRGSACRGLVGSARRTSSPFAWAWPTNLPSTSSSLWRTRSKPTGVSDGRWSA